MVTAARTRKEALAVRRVLTLIGFVGIAGFLVLAVSACEPPDFPAQYPGLSIEVLCNEIFPLDRADAEAALAAYGVTDPLKVDLLLSISPAQNCP